jgi:hypothetical protein
MMQTYIYAVMAVAGIALIIWSVISYARVTKFLQQSTETTGEVIRLQKFNGGAQFPGCDYAPVFLFRTASGESVTVTSDVATSPPGFTVGQSVRVRYDASNPSEAKIHTLLQIWGDSVIPAVVGVFFLIIAAFKVYEASL